MDKESIYFSAPRLIDDEEIEYNVANTKSYKEKQYYCPQCTSSKMHKMNFFYTDHILDYCSKCCGFFFDGEEYDEFDKYTFDKGIFKDYISGHLVRIDTLYDLYISVGKRNYGPCNNVFFLKFTVFFNNPLDPGLVLFPASGIENFFNLFGLFRKQSIKTDNKEFNQKFTLQCEDTTTIEKLFSVKKLVLELVDFLNSPPMIYSKKGTFKVLNNRISYVAGPFRSEETHMEYDTQNDPSGIIGKMVRIASIIDDESQI